MTDTEQAVTPPDRGDATSVEPARPKHPFLTDWRFYVVLAYVLIMLTLLLAELGVPLIRQYRATDQVIVLVTLLFLPFFLFFASTIVQKLKVRLPNGQEVEVELDRVQSKTRELDSKLDRQHSLVSKATKDLAGRVDMAEQALLPIILGQNPVSRKRLDQGELIIGSKEFSEQQIVSNILAGVVGRALSGQGVRVQRVIPNGSSYKNFADLRYGWIDGYVEYTGTGMMLMMVLDQFFDRSYSLGETIAMLDGLSRERFGIAWLKPIGLHNEYVLVLDREIAERYGIEKISDLSAVCDKLDFCFTLEFLNRRDGLERVRQKYHFNFRSEFDVGIDERYRMMQAGEAQLTSGFATDPEIEDGNVVVLRDEDMIFPDYHAVPIFRVEALERIDSLESSINALADQVGNKRIMAMINEYNRNGASLSVARGIAEGFVDEIFAS